MKLDPLGPCAHASAPAEIRWPTPDGGDAVNADQGESPRAQPSPPLHLDAPPAPIAPPPLQARPPLRRLYFAALTWAFMLFTTARLLAYVPTVMAILHTRDSSQHSLWTWLTWFGANLTMAAWMYEHNGQRFDKAIGVSLSNAAACGFTTLVILYFR